MLSKNNLLLTFDRNPRKADWNTLYILKNIITTLWSCEPKDINIHVSEKETPIENLIEYVFQLIATECPNLSNLATELYIFEGLTKGFLYI